VGIMRILDSTGDTMLEWSPDDARTTMVASETFTTLTAKKYLPFARLGAGAAADTDRIHSFDPSLAEIIWIRPIAGG